MKKILSLLLLSVFAVTLFCSCSAPVIYPEEDAARKWLKERTVGYEKLENGATWLRKDAQGFLVYLATSSQSAKPFLEVEYDPSNVKTRDSALITVYGNGQSHGAVYNTNCVFDPYANDYHHSMQVYRKDEDTYRIFFWFYYADTDFYPIPKLLTEEQYQQMLTIVNAYTDEQYQISENAGEKPINYAGAFLDSYKATYASDLVSDPTGSVFYEYAPLSKELQDKHGGNNSYFVVTFHNLFQDLNLSVQDWRDSFASLGYGEYRPAYQILYFDLTIGSSVIGMDLKTSDVYFSPALQDSGIIFNYDFCPELAKQSFMRVTKS
ncbi:MAG: hypothetical protein J6M34_02590 [Clostridia bacterium]|nr:hypothetical protein [Clostridia bacterium]